MFYDLFFMLMGGNYFRLDGNYFLSDGNNFLPFPTPYPLNTASCSQTPATCPYSALLPDIILYFGSKSKRLSGAGGEVGRVLEPVDVLLFDRMDEFNELRRVQIERQGVRRRVVT